MSNQAQEAFQDLQGPPMSERDIELVPRSLLSEGRWQSILALADLLPSALWIYSSEDRLVYANNAFEQIWGRARQELPTRAAVMAMIHPDDRAMLPREAPLDAKIPDHRIVRPDGSIRWVRVRVTNGARVGISGGLSIATAEDVTDYHLMKHEQQANREKDNFLAMLSHELRTPLTPVLAAISGMEQELSVPTGLRNDLAMIHRNIDLEARLIDDLLDLTRISHGKLRLEPKITDAQDLLLHAIETATPDIESKRITLRKQLGTQRSLIFADPARIQQVYWNIIKNAVQYTPPGGTIDIQTREEGPMLVVRVSDSGVGIDPAFLPRIFDAFEQENRPGRHGALGLGLAISRTVVDLHGGSISAESPGRGLGSTFTVSLQLADANATEADQGVPQARPDSKRSLRILMVEDHPTTREVFVRLLKRMGHKVESAGTLAEAIASASGAEFDLLISDIGLPDGSGLDLMRHIKGRPGLHAIALTGYGMENDIEQCYSAGFDAHLTKPVDVAALCDTIHEVMDSH